MKECAKIYIVSYGGFPHGFGKHELIYQNFWINNLNWQAGKQPDDYKKDFMLLGESALKKIWDTKEDEEYQDWIPSNMSNSFVDRR